MRSGISGIVVWETDASQSMKGKKVHGLHVTHSVTIVTVHQGEEGVRECVGREGVRVCVWGGGSGEGEGRG